MSNSTNLIKALAQRFASLPPLSRMKLTKKLLELYSSDQASGKSFLEQFWDEVEEAHGGHLHAANPFREEGRSKALGIKAAAKTNQPDGYFNWHINQSDLIALL